jgi:hypothetical protein
LNNLLALLLEGEDRGEGGTLPRARGNLEVRSRITSVGTS